MVDFRPRSVPHGRGGPSAGPRFPVDHTMARLMEAMGESEERMRGRHSKLE